MVIGYDAKYTLENKGGLGHYGRLVIEAMAEYHKHNDYILYAPDTKEGTTLINNLLVHASVHLKTPHDAIFTKKWRAGKGILHDAHRHSVKVFHGIGGELPSGIENSDIVGVVSLGTLSFVHYPDKYSFLQRHRLKKAGAQACKISDKILAMSNFAKQEIVDYYGVSPDKVEVILPACELRFQAELSEQATNVLREKYTLPEHYAFVAGDFDERHNIKKVAEAMALLKDTHLSFVVVGHHNRFFEELKNLASSLGVGGRLVRVSKVNESDLPVIYSEAEVVVCPSRYEWTSLSILRSMTVGTPVVAAKGSCMEEYGGNAALYFNPDSAEEIADAMRLAIGEKRVELIAAGREQIELLSPQNYSNKLNEFYHSLVEKK